jgi:hypothetical protein
MRRQVVAGENPVERKRREREAATRRTFQALADRYLEEHARRHKRSADADERNLGLHVLPRWGKRRYDEITRANVREIVRRGLEEARGNYKIVGRLFNMEPRDYKRFLNFLRKHDCQIPFKDYR